MKVRNFLFVMILLLVCSTVQAQLDFRHKKSAPVFPRDLKHKGIGYFGGVGGTYSVTFLSPKRATVVDNAVDTFWTIDLTPSAKVGVYLEAGRYHLLEYSKAWRYIDYGVAYKSLRGTELWEEKLLTNGFTEPQTIATGQVNFSQHYVSAFFNANNIKEYAGKRVLQNSFGLRVAYNALNWSEQLKIPSVANTQAIKGKLLAQAHYKLGFGFKVKGRMLIIPSVELPFFNLWPFDLRMGGVGIFNSRYNPVLFNIRILPFGTRFKRYFK